MYLFLFVCTHTCAYIKYVCIVCIWMSSISVNILGIIYYETLLFIFQSWTMKDKAVIQNAVQLNHDVCEVIYWLNNLLNKDLWSTC